HIDGGAQQAATGLEDIQLPAGDARRVVFGKLYSEFAALTQSDRRILDNRVVDGRPAFGEIGDGHAVSVHALLDIELTRGNSPVAIGVHDVPDHRFGRENRGHAVLTKDVQVR